MEEKQKLIIPSGPPPRVIREGALKWCDKCHSTMTKMGFLGLFGKLSCDNPKCINHIK